MDVTDYTHDGRCSNCGACCSNYLPLTNRELNRLKAWVKKHQFKPTPVAYAEVLDFTCPFLDKSTTRCSCYKIRPEVCRQFNCHDYVHGNIAMSKSKRRYQVYNLRSEIFGEESVSYTESLLLLEYLRQRKEKPNE